MNNLIRDYRKYAYLIGTIVSLFTGVLFTGQSIRWLRLEKGEYNTWDEKVDIPVANISNPLPDRSYYVNVKHTIYRISGTFPTISTKETVVYGKEVMIDKD
jgi:hypothetical protein